MKWGDVLDLDVDLLGESPLRPTLLVANALYLPKTIGFGATAACSENNAPAVVFTERETQAIALIAQRDGLTCDELYALARTKARNAEPLTSLVEANPGPAATRWSFRQLFAHFRLTLVAVHIAAVGVAHAEMRDR